MELKHQYIFIILSVAFVASHAALPSEIYWKTVLPNTPMPQSIKDSLPTERLSDNKGALVGGGGGGGVGVDVGSGGNTDVNVRHGGGSYHGWPINVYVGAGNQPFMYNYAATDDQLHDNPNVALFFLEKRLIGDEKMQLHFSKNSNGATFLPRRVADSIPFSSNKMAEIFDRFSVKPNTAEAEAIKKTIKECEDKFCATSLEAMVDFTTSKLGKNVKAISTNTQKDMSSHDHQQEYQITGVEKLDKGKAVVCHKQNYAYAVYYCHKTETTKAYRVNLVGEDGTQVKAAAVCHEDTSAWNPKHLAFQVLKVKPGSVPVCHFLPQDHVVWVAS